MEYEVRWQITYVMKSFLMSGLQIVCYSYHPAGFHYQKKTDMLSI